MIRVAALVALAVSAAGAQPVEPLPQARGVTLDAFARPASGMPWPDSPTSVPRWTDSERDSTALPDDWIARDKAMHVSASFLLTLSGQYVLTDKSDLSGARALPVAAGSALALGVLKEVADARRPRHPHFCWRDLAADAVGVALAVALIEL